MVKLIITIDVEGPKEVVGGKLHHLNYEKSIEAPCYSILKIAKENNFKITFFLPLGELIEDYPQVIDLVDLFLKEDHDIQAHLHLPFPLMSKEEIIDRLSKEIQLFEKYVGKRPVAIRAGAYNVGKGRKWIESILEAGFRIDSSVCSGLNIVISRGKDIKIKTEEARWGKGALFYDFRNAPLAGAYFVDEQSLAKVGNSSLLEIPITMEDYNETYCEAYKFNLGNPNFVLLSKKILRKYLTEKAMANNLILNMMGHSGFRSQKSIKNLKWIIYLLKKREKRVEVITLKDIEIDKIKPFYLWGKEQPGYWLERRKLNLGVQPIETTLLISDMFCPECKGNLITDKKSILCQSCNRKYRISNGILLMVPEPPLFSEPNIKSGSVFTSSGNLLRRILSRISILKWMYKILKFCKNQLLPSIFIFLLLVLFLPLALIIKIRDRKKEKLSIYLPTLLKSDDE